VDNERVVVTEWRFPPGSETGWHVHAHDYVVTYRTAAKHLIEAAAGSETILRRAGETYFRKAGVEHNVVNVGTDEVVFIEIEIK
jgi:quercetin dioxygenase-like cupin family protein